MVTMEKLEQCLILHLNDLAIIKIDAHSFSVSQLIDEFTNCFRTRERKHSYKIILIQQGKNKNY